MQILLSGLICLSARSVTGGGRRDPHPVSAEDRHQRRQHLRRHRQEHDSRGLHHEALPHGESRKVIPCITQVRKCKISVNDHSHFVFFWRSVHIAIVQEISYGCSKTSNMRLLYLSLLTCILKVVENAYIINCCLILIYLSGFSTKVAGQKGPWSRQITCEYITQNPKPVRDTTQIPAYSYNYNSCMNSNLK